MLPDYQIMRFTRKEILQKNEAKLRMEVLKPLFERMGFKDVFHHHGQSEMGKDFVMWKEGDIGERINYAVVVKAERITGRAENRSGTAGGVATQIQQCFGLRFLDLHTAEEQRVNRCWVISSKEISKEARESIKAVLSTTILDRLVLFVDGERLWKLIIERFPECEVVENITRAGEILETLDEEWRVRVSTGGGQNAFTLEPKNPQSHARPLSFKFKLAFPDDHIGRSKLEEVQSGFERGTRVAITRPHILEAEIPEFLRSLIGQVEKLEFQPAPQGKPTEVVVEVHSDDGDSLRLDSLVLKTERSGTKEVLLSNSHQQLPWVFKILLSRDKKAVSLVWHIELGAFNVHRLLKAAKLWQCMSKPGQMSMELVETGFRILKLRTESAEPKPEPPEVGLIALLEDLAFIQRTTGVELHLPSEATAAEIARVHYLSHAIREGRAVAKGLNVTQTFDRETAVSILSVAERGNTVGPHTICAPNHTENILGQPAALGPIALHMSAARISAESLNLLKSDLREAGEGEFKVTFESVGDSETELFFLKWLPNQASLPPSVKQIIDENVLERLKGMSSS